MLLLALQMGGGSPQQQESSKWSRVDMFPAGKTFKAEFSQQMEGWGSRRGLRPHRSTDL